MRQEHLYLLRSTRTYPCHLGISSCHFAGGFATLMSLCGGFQSILPEHMSNSMSRRGDQLRTWFTGRKLDTMLDRRRSFDEIQLIQDPGLKAVACLQDAVTAENAGQRLHLRVERQTLSRLPRTGAVLFTIRTHMKRLDHFEGRPDAVRRPPLDGIPFTYASLGA